MGVAHYVLERGGVGIGVEAEGEGELVGIRYKLDECGAVQGKCIVGSSIFACWKFFVCQIKGSRT